MTEIIVVHEKPLIYGELQRLFGVDWNKGVIIAYDGKVYCKEELQPQKAVHEAVHLYEQSMIGNDAWWKLYMTNSQFRLDEEVKAMRAELKFIRKYIPNREHRFKFEKEIFKSLSSSTYVNLVTLDQAKRLLNS